MVKKLLLSVLALTLVGGQVLAQTVSVSDVDVMAGRTGSFTVSLSGGKADTYTAMTLYVQFPETGFTTEANYAVSSLWTGATATVGDVNDQGLASIPIASSNPIPGTAVDNLVTIYFNVASNVPVGDYDVMLKSTLFEYNPAGKDYADDVTFKVRVSDRIVLRETATTLPVIDDDEEEFNVTVYRTLNAGEWSTICLPFDMDEKQVKAAFGEDVQLATFKSWSSQKTGNNVESINVVFEEETEIDARWPYVIKVSSPVSSFSVENVCLNVEDQPKTEVGKKSKGTLGTFTGNFLPMNIPANSLFLSGNKFYYSAGKTKMKALRAYFTFQDILAEVTNANTRIAFSFDDATDVKELKNSRTEELMSYYNLNGQRVSQPKKGLYVRGGKKVIIK